ncbi:MAG: methyltransferase domain-containing protein [Ilumatobacter sp.]|nr:methyltransferase domain-containing protein [Ilumatobacter sp.]
MVTTPAETTVDDALESPRARAMATAVWEDCDDEEYRRHISHYRNSTLYDDAGFETLVNNLAGRITALYRSAGQPPGQPRRGLDWGSGGGASSLALRRSCGHVTSVDISSKNLDETARQFQSGQIDGAEVGFTPILADTDPSAVAARLPHPIDVFVSTSTFHVLPDRALAGQILRTGFSVMRPNAVGYVQIRYDDGTQRYRPRQGLDGYAANHLFASSWTLTEFWALLEDVGFRPVNICNMNTSSNFAGFAFRK